MNYKRFYCNMTCNVHLCVTTLVKEYRPTINLTNNTRSDITTQFRFDKTFDCFLSIIYLRAVVTSMTVAQKKLNDFKHKVT